MSSNRHKLLLIEDDTGLQRQLKWALDAYEVHCAGTRVEAIEALQRHRPALILQDLGLPPDEDGVEEGFASIAAAHRIVPRSKIIVLTGREGREHALRAIGLGAHDFCQKPIDAALLATIVERAVRLYELEADIERASAGQSLPPLEGIIAASEPMRRVCRTIERLAPSNTTVLLLGESGTGKERFARALHGLSPRAGKPLIAINCAAIPESLLESELFGFERGAFTGAVTQKVGHIERANGGTLFLDEIGDMPLNLQAKLLRFLQDRTIERLGGRNAIRVDVRVIAATNRELEGAIERGTFRLDLFYRIGEVSITIPPLRERASDCLLIANHLLRLAGERNGRKGLCFSAEAIGAIEAHSWPGNVRELENRVNRASILTEGRVIGPDDLGLAAIAPPEVQATTLPTLRETRQRAEFEAVQRALALAGGNVSKAAELLDITRPTLYEILNRTRLGRGGE